tara:strand:+ start:351 stop:614 length:264 start_codon:yes stop_codon:yes gene_type:complete
MKKYVTVRNNNSLKYREISLIMTKNGDKMNHMTVKNIINRGFVKIIDNISNEYGKNLTYEEKLKIAQSPDFQESIAEIIRKIDNEKK